MRNMKREILRHPVPLPTLELIVFKYNVHLNLLTSSGRLSDI